MPSSAQLHDHCVNQIKAITFDVVGTLIDFETGIVNAIREIANDPNYSQVVGSELEAETILHAFGEAEGILQEQQPDLPFTQMLAPIYDQHLCTRLQLPPGQGDRFRQSIRYWPAFADSVAALAWLKTRYTLVALTNADNWALHHMSNTLQNPFTDTVTCEDVGVNKPNARVFEYSRGRLSRDGLMQADIMHVAQSQYHDIGIAKELGYFTCWIERRQAQAGFGATPVPTKVTAPDVHVSSLQALVDFIQGA